MATHDFDRAEILITYEDGSTWTGVVDGRWATLFVPATPANIWRLDDREVWRRRQGGRRWNALVRTYGWEGARGWRQGWGDDTCT